MRTRHDIARAYGYTLRTCLDGAFINQGSDDLMKIKNDGHIDVYAHDANAYFVACLIRDTPQ